MKRKDAIKAKVRKVPDEAVGRTEKNRKAVRRRRVMPLTPLQKEFLRMAADGMTREEIAKAHGTCVTSTRDVAKSAFKKLGARNCVHAVAIAVRRRII